jgi:hypothetical protein
MRLAGKRGFVPQQDDLPEFTHERRRALPDHRNAYIDLYRQRSDSQVRFSVSVIEYSSPEEAHEGLVDFLTTVMAPTLPSAAEKGIEVGDVGFAGYAQVQTGVSFVKDNVFIRVESVGEKAASVKVIAMV